MILFLKLCTEDPKSYNLPNKTSPFECYGREITNSYLVKKKLKLLWEDSDYLLGLISAFEMLLILVEAV